MSNHPVPPVPSSGGGVRRHHTISASSRTARANSREVISEETPDQQSWAEDEVVDQDWVGGVGAVGEKSSLHRQSSLPTRYHRGFHGGKASKAGNLTPKTVNSLAAIAGHEGDEEVWDIGNFQVPDDEQTADQHQPGVGGLENQPASNTPLSPHGYAPAVPSPPPATSGASVRRHVSLTYGAAVGGPRKINAGLKRSGTLQASVPPSQSQNTTPPESAQHEEEDPYGYDPDDGGVYDDEYLRQQQGQYPGSPIGRGSPWASGNEWRTPTGSGFSTSSGNGGGNFAMDDVQRALSALEVASNTQQAQQAQQSIYQQNTYPGGQSAHPPRFNPPHPPPAFTPGRHGSGHTNNGSNGNSNGNGGRRMSVNTDEGRKTPSGQSYQSGQNPYQPPQQGDSRGQLPGGAWDPKDRSLGGRTSNSNLQYGYQQGSGHGKTPSTGSGNGGVPGGNIPSVPPIPQQYLQQGQAQPRLGLATSFTPQNQGGAAGSGQTPSQGFVNTPIDVPSLIAAKGYNPPNFDVRPQFARFFVIKSYTEDDVHKSLKYEIWSSTDPGNKRLDKAFKETAGRGPIYLFFSVNASGHFCGMAEMLTPVDYTRSSTVWASDKWKGVFKVRWIFVRDIPNVNLRHIKLNNTQERKPVTNSRDTQELLPDAGQEMLRIFHTHPARTSLLQDFAFYELQAMQKMQSNTASPGTSPNPSAIHSPQLPNASLAMSSPQLQQQQQQQTPPQPQHSPTFNPNALAYQMPQMTPMMQMQMQMGMMGMGGMGAMGMGSPMTAFAMPQQQQTVTQAMHQSVMRHPSPSPRHGQQSPGQQHHTGQSFLGLSNF